MNNIKTLGDFVKALKDGTLQIAPNNYFDNPEDLIIELEWRRKNEFDQPIRFDYGWRNRDTVATFPLYDHDEANYRDFVEPLNVYSNVVDETLRLEIRNGWVRPYVTIFKRDSMDSFRVYNKVGRDIRNPITATIQIPSKKVSFANFFRTTLSDLPEDKEHRSEYSVGHIEGCRNRTHYMASKGFGFGQMGNMSIGIYSNGKEIILADPYLAEESGYTIEDFEDEERFEDYRKGFEEEQKLEKYLQENKFVKKGKISCEVWRWECADANLVKDIECGYDESQIIVPIRGKSIEITHYYRTLAHGQSPISSEVYSHLIVK